MYWPPASPLDCKVVSPRRGPTRRWSRTDRGHRSYSYAVAVAVLRASTARREAPCEYLPRCGGCPWQHIDDAAQVEAKRAIVGELLRRIAGCTVEIGVPLASPRQFGYRQRLKLRVDRGRSASMRRVDTTWSRSTTSVAEPPVARRSRPPPISCARSRRASAASKSRRARARPIASCWHAKSRRWPRRRSACRKWWRRIRRSPVGDRVGRAAADWGEHAPPDRARAVLRYAVRAGSFTQVNREANRLLVQTVVRQVEPAEDPRARSLRRRGNLSLSLSKRGARS